MASAVIDEGGESDGRIEAIIGDDGDEPAIGEALGGEAVVIFGAGLPVAAVEEDDDVTGAVGMIGDIDVEFLCDSGP